MLNKLMVTLGLKPALSGAALHAKTRGILVDIWEDKGLWYFQYVPEDGGGEVMPAVSSQEDAIFLFRQWYNGLPSHAKLCLQWRYNPPAGL